MFFGLFLNILELNSTLYSSLVLANQNKSNCVRGILMDLICYSYRETGEVKFLTKGDNNQVDDRGLYAPGQFWLEKKDVVGRAKGYVFFPAMCLFLC